MRPDTPTIDSRAALGDRVDAIADDVDGRLGAFLGVPRSDDEFDVVYRRHAGEQFPAASTIKVLVGYALYREHDGALGALDRPRAIAEENRVGGSGVARLFEEDLSLRSLYRAMIAVSDNAATNELIDYLGTDRINDAADDLALSETELGRKMMTTVEDDGGDPDHSTDPENAISPRDGARLLAELLYGDRLSTRAHREQLRSLRAQNDRWLFARYLPDGLALAHKPGWLPDAALEVGIVLPESGGPGSGNPERPRETDWPLVFAVCCDHLPGRGEGADAVAAVGDAVRAWVE